MGRAKWGEFSSPRLFFLYNDELLDRRPDRKTHVLRSKKADFQAGTHAGTHVPHYNICQHEPLDEQTVKQYAIMRSVVRNVGTATLIAREVRYATNKGS